MEKEEATVALRTFEGLFLRSLAPTEGLLAALRDVGFDPSDTRPLYPSRIWRASLEAARLQLYPELPVAEGFRKIGKAFAEGFARTVVGHVFALSAPLLGPERVLARVPSYLRAARSDVAVTMDAHGPRHWVAHFRDPYGTPDFLAGALEEMLTLAHVRATTVLSQVDGDHFSVDIRW